MVVVNVAPERSLRSAKQFKVQGLEALGIKQLGDTLPEGLSNDAIERGRHYIKLAETDYFHLGDGIGCLGSDKEVAYEQYKRCLDLLNRLWNYRVK